MKWQRHIISITGIGLLLLLCSGFPKKKVAERRVLFVGNNMTEAHGMTGILQKMLDEQHITVKVKESTQYGFSLYEHLFMVKRGAYWSDATNGEIPTTVKAIGNGQWDMIVLQENLDNILIPEITSVSSEPSHRYMDSLAKLVKSKIILFQLYADGKYPQKRCFTRTDFFHADNLPIQGPVATHCGPKSYCSDSFTNAADEYKVIQQAYKRIAAKLEAPLVPVGAAFELCKRKYPGINLYDHTESPSKQGAYLTACMFYRYIAKKKLTSIKYCADVSATEAKLLREIADAVVVNQGSK